MLRMSLLLALLVIPVLHALAQDQPVIDKRRAVVEAIQAVRQYPLEIRMAVPVVAQHPKLAEQLLDAVNRKDSLDEVLAKYPKEVQEAGKTLAKNPEVLETMVMLPALTKAVGEVYAKEGPEALRDKIDRFLKDETPQTEASVQAWTRRLSGNRVALRQLLDAVSDLMEEKPGVEHQDYGCGVSVSPGRVTVYALLPGPVTAYVLAHADEFAELADEMFEQWLQTNSSTDFDHAMERWWGVARRYFSPQLLEPEGRAERLAELASLAKQFGKERKSDQPPSDAEAEKFIQEHRQDMPLTSKYLLAPGIKIGPVKEGETVPKPKVAARPKPAAVVITPPRKRAVTVKPKPRPEKAPLPQTITREEPTYDQQVRRASQENYYYWFYYQQPMSPYFFYNPYYYRWPWHGHKRPAFNRPIRPRR